MKKSIVILGASEFGVIAAKELNIDVYLISEKNSTITPKVIKNTKKIFFVDSLENYNACKDLVDRIIQDKEIVLIISFTELGLETASRLSEFYGIPQNKLAVVKNSRNKSKMRKIFNKNSELRLDHFSGNVSELKKLKDIKYPIIIKPIDGFGSKSVFKIDNCSSWKIWLKENDHLQKLNWIIEPFIDGPEFSVETVSIKGKHFVLGITEKTTSGPPRFFEVGHKAPANINEELKIILEKVTINALNQLAVRFGPCHTEVKLDKNTLQGVVIETHTRPGGDYIPLLHKLSSSLDQYKLGILSFLLSENSFNKELEKVSKLKSAEISFLKYDKSGLLKSISISDVEKSIYEVQFYNQVGANVSTTIDSFTRAGHVIKVFETSSKRNELLNNYNIEII